MAKSIFVFDTEDKELGVFYQKCKTDIELFFENTKNSIDIIKGEQLDDLTISLKLDKITHFVFGAYSHGDENNLVVSGTTPYISKELNSTQFEGVVFYTFSCSSGKELGKHLVENKCQCFIGYKKEVSVWIWILKPFVITANYGIKLFFDGKNTEEIVREMKDEYTRQIDGLYKTNFFVTSILRENRDALVMHGKNMTIQDLDI